MSHLVMYRFPTRSLDHFAWAIRDRDGLWFRYLWAYSMPSEAGGRDEWACPKNDSVVPLLHASSLGDTAATAAMTDLLIELEAPAWIPAAVSGDPEWYWLAANDNDYWRGVYTTHILDRSDYGRTRELEDQVRRLTEQLARRHMYSVPTMRLDPAILPILFTDSTRGG